MNFKKSTKNSNEDNNLKLANYITESYIKLYLPEYNFIINSFHIIERFDFINLIYNSFYNSVLSDMQSR